MTATDALAAALAQDELDEWHRTAFKDKRAEIVMASLAEAGYVIVPKEMSEEALEAGADEAHCPVDVMRVAWRFMLAAAVGQSSQP